MHSGELWIFLLANGWNSSQKTSVLLPLILVLTSNKEAESTFIRFQTTWTIEGIVFGFLSEETDTVTSSF